MPGFYKRVVATHVIYNNIVYDVDNFATTVLAGGAGSTILLPENTTSIPPAADVVIDLAATANGATGVFSRPAHIPVAAVNGIIRIRGHISNASGVGSAARIVITGEPSASSWSHAHHLELSAAADANNSIDNTAWVQIGGTVGPYPGVNYTFNKTGTPSGFFTIQWIGYTI